MSKRIVDINKKLAYLTHPRAGPKLKTFHPLVLKDKIEKASRTSGVQNKCTDQYNDLLNCLSDNDFMNSRCSKELATLLTCEKKQQAELTTQAELQKKGQTLDGSVDKETKNKLLQMYPTSFNKKAMDIQRNNYITLPSHRKKTVPNMDPGRPFNKR